MHNKQKTLALVWSDVSRQTSFLGYFSSGRFMREELFSFPEARAWYIQVCNQELDRLVVTQSRGGWPGRCTVLKTLPYLGFAVAAHKNIAELADGC